MSAIVSSRLIPRAIFSSMKSPITSPCVAVLTSSATITLTPYSSAFARASRAPETSLWSVTAIAPRPCRRAVASSTSTGVAQSLEWSVCMCRSTSRSRRDGLRQALAQRLVGQQPRQLRRERLRVGGLEQQPERAVAQHLLVDLQPRGDGDRAGAERAHEQAGRGRLADRGGDDDVGGREHLLLARLRAGHDLDAVAQAAAQRARARADRREDRRAPGAVRRQAAQRAQEQPQSLAVLVVDER